ncbi:MAG: TolC family protein [Planctomycetaceae bacterium]
MTRHITDGSASSVLPMPHATLIVGCCIVSCLVTAGGCVSRDVLKETIANDTVKVDSISSRVDNFQPEVFSDVHISTPFTPRQRPNYDAIVYEDVTLDSVLSIAMSNSQVLRDLGGTMLRSPDALATRFTMPLQQTDPRFGMEAALAAFDAQFAMSGYFNNNDQTYNNSFFSGGTNTFRQDLHNYNAELSKATATGSRLALRSVSRYDSNNAPGNLFPSAFDTYLEGELRQPLLQGGGVQFNRIAGPGSTPGVYNGILLARVNNDISQADFEIAVRDYVSNVINAYWDLYFAYRDLDARTRAMNRALDAWKRLEANKDEESGARIALAREQYYRFKAEVDESISGRNLQGTQTRNGSTGGTLRGTEGVQVAERRLRLLTGMAVADGRMLRPIDEPEQAPILFDWDAVTNEAVAVRPELRKQQLRVRQREMELLAARNFLAPRLDAVGKYRFRGFGGDLINQGGNQAGMLPSSAVGNMLTGQLQEWQVGFEFTVPIGYRRAHLAVTNAELMLSRARVLQREQQKAVVHDLVNAVADAERAHEACENNMNRYLAAREVLKAYEVKEEAGQDLDIDRLLDAQRRALEAEIRYFQSKAEYALALKNVHFEKGSLMSANNLGIVDGNSSMVIGSTDVESVGEQPPQVQLAQAESPEPEPAGEQPADDSATSGKVRLVSASSDIDE